MGMNKWMDVQDLLAGGMERKNGWTDGWMGWIGLVYFLCFTFHFSPLWLRVFFNGLYFDCSFLFTYVCWGLRDGGRRGRFEMREMGGRQAGISLTNDYENENMIDTLSCV